MTSPKVAVLHDPLFEAHDPGAWHPERPARLTAILSALEASGQLERMERVKPRPATRAELDRVHLPALVDEILALRGQHAVIDPDTSASPRSVDAAELAAGGCIVLLDRVLELEGGRGLALVRPPGHHATKDRSMGFCLFNNVAVAAAHALEERGLERILIVDWDVHHGNGTQDIFYGDPRVLYFSVHQYPFYPGTGYYTEIGEGEGLGRTVNVPLPAGTEDGDLLEVFRSLLTPAAEKFRPQLVLVSAGFDGHLSDALASWRLSDAGYGALAYEVEQLARVHSGGRWLAFLEGGYDLPALAASVARVASVMLGETPTELAASASPYALRIIEQARELLRRSGTI